MSEIIRIKLHTPIWTGGYEGRPQGLKMSGVIGGMRSFFEMLVRKFGGNTCDITSANSHYRCSYSEDKPKICPACALFGCTGLSKAFKLIFPIDELNLKAIQTIPEKDYEIKNRQSKGTEYGHPLEVAKWLAVCAGLSNTMRGYTTAMNDLKSKINLYYNQNDIDLQIVPIRKPIGNLNQEDTFSIVKYLLYVMSYYHGIGSKIHQGWGVFEIKKNQLVELKEKGKEALRKLINSFPYNPPFKYDLPNANDLYMTEFEYDKPITFDIKQNLNNPYLETGFAMRYRLRRYIKFFDKNQLKPYYDNSIKPPKLKKEWQKLVNNLEKPWSNTVWKDNIPFTRIIFGLDNANDETKIAGLLGMSHQFKKNDKWYVRLYLRLPHNLKTYYVNTNERIHNNIPQVTLDLNPELINNFVIDRMKELFKLSGSFTYKNAEI